MGGAARRVGLSQPAMSHALGRLRTVFGDPLLVRVGARMQLTLRAESVRGPLGDVLEQVRGVLRDGAFDPTSSTRVFRVLMSDYASGVVLPPLLARLRREARRVRVDVAPWPGRHGDLFAAARTADLALTCDPETPAGFGADASSWTATCARSAAAIRESGGFPSTLGAPLGGTIAGGEGFGATALDHVAAELRVRRRELIAVRRRALGTRRADVVAHAEVAAAIPESRMRAQKALVLSGSFDGGWTPGRSRTTVPP